MSSASLKKAPPPEELALLRARAERGDAAAQYEIGVLCSDGRGVPRDEAQATRWFGKAAEQGNRDAQFCLGVKCEHGIGVPQDYVQAMVCYCRAAEQGHADAQFALGAMYAFARGVPQDFAEAFMWMHLATCGATGRSDKRRYKHGRGAVANWLSRAQMTKARKLAQVWAAAISQRRPKEGGREGCRRTEREETLAL